MDHPSSSPAQALDRQLSGRSAFLNTLAVHVKEQQAVRNVGVQSTRESVLDQEKKGCSKPLLAALRDPESQDPGSNGSIIDTTTTHQAGPGLTGRAGPSTHGPLQPEGAGNSAGDAACMEMVQPEGQSPIPEEHQLHVPSSSPHSPHAAPWPSISGSARPVLHVPGAPPGEAMPAATPPAAPLDQPVLGIDNQQAIPHIASNAASRPGLPFLHMSGSLDQPAQDSFMIRPPSLYAASSVGQQAANDAAVKPTVPSLASPMPLAASTAAASGLRQIPQTSPPGALQMPSFLSNVLSKPGVVLPGTSSGLPYPSQAAAAASHQVPHAFAVSPCAVGQHTHSGKECGPAGSPAGQSSQQVAAGQHRVPHPANMQMAPPVLPHQGSQPALHPAANASSAADVSQSSPESGLAAMPMPMKRLSRPKPRKSKKQKLLEEAEHQGFQPQVYTDQQSYPGGQPFGGPGVLLTTTSQAAQHQPGQNARNGPGVVPMPSSQPAKAHPVQIAQASAAMDRGASHVALPNPVPAHLVHTGQYAVMNGGTAQYMQGPVVMGPAEWGPGAAGQVFSAPQGPAAGAQSGMMMPGSSGMVMAMQPPHGPTVTSAPQAQMPHLRPIQNGLRPIQNGAPPMQNRPQALPGLTNHGAHRGVANLQPVGHPMQTASLQHPHLQSRVNGLPAAHGPMYAAMSRPGMPLEVRHGPHMQPANAGAAAAATAGPHHWAPPSEQPVSLKRKLQCPPAPNASTAQAHGYYGSPGLVSPSPSQTSHALHAANAPVVPSINGQSPVPLTWQSGQEQRASAVKSNGNGFQAAAVHPSHPQVTPHAAAALPGGHAMGIAVSGPQQLLDKALARKAEQQAQPCRDQTFRAPPSSG